MSDSEYDMLRDDEPLEEHAQQPDEQPAIPHACEPTRIDALAGSESRAPKDDVTTDAQDASAARDSFEEIPQEAKDNTTAAQEDTDTVQGHGHGDEHPTTPQPEAQPSGEALRPASPKDREAGTLSLDIADSITGMYRILDLISEQGSGGLVDKVVIAQESVARFVNDVSPGAYQSLTKIDFKALDELSVKPVGVYGSKSEIVKLLQTSGKVDEETAQLLLDAKDDSPGRRLRSGLYFVRMAMPDSKHEQMFVIYWPEDTTWDDDAVSAVRKNRVTFIRYLTKIADQTMCLISPEHAQKLVWNEAAAEEDEDEDDVMSLDEDGDEEEDRFFSFEVAKTNEQEEDVTVRPGFKMHSRALEMPRIPAEGPNASVMAPKLVAGETAQAFLTARYAPGTTSITSLDRTGHNRLQVEQYFKPGQVRLGEQLDEGALHLLMKYGLRDAFPGPCFDYEQGLQNAEADLEATIQSSRREADEKFSGDGDEQLWRAVHVSLLTFILARYPSLESRMRPGDDTQEGPVPDKSERAASNGNKDGVAENHESPSNDKANELDADKTPKKPEDGAEARTEALRKNDPSQAPEDPFARVVHSFPELSSKLHEQMQHEGVDRIAKFVPEFKSLKECLTLARVAMDEPTFAQLSPEKRDTVLNVIVTEGSFKGILDGATKKSNRSQLLGKIKSLNIFSSNKEIGVEDDIARRASDVAHRTSDPDFLARLADLAGRNPALEPSVARTMDVARTYLDDVLHRSLDALMGTLQKMQKDRLLSQRRGEAQTEQRRRCKTLRQSLIRAVNEGGRPDATLVTHIDDIKAVYHASYSYPHRQLTFDVRGQEQRRLPPTITYALHPLRLHTDDRHALQQDRTHIPALRESSHLPTFVLPAQHRIRHIQLLANERCLLIIDNSQGNFLIYLQDVKSLDGANLDAVQCMKPLHHDKLGPATLVLDVLPVCALPSPDGGCVVLMFESRDNTTLAARAYHWSTFGSSQGIILDLPDVHGNAVLTSIVNRSVVHLAWVDPAAGFARSYALDISKKVTEFSFQEKGTSAKERSNAQTVHNSLVECHADVWTRFPVVPAISRQTLVTGTDRQAKKFIFVSDLHQNRFAPYLLGMIQSFEQRTRKPTGKALRSIQIRATSFNDCMSSFAHGVEWGADISRLNLGEWLVTVFCLIPIHIAVARDNRFVPLKDGIYSVELERELLGADVGQIVDSLTLGWYESIFQSYQATKPVKVVSSMGEQSVGKSFALNHLVDTSFAGSAMRTTEGVWMSVTPTDTALVVALDFEGVHSIERSAQEDMLLVLFNAAISNLVLFRNNFALSRDITGLFQSFQSSSAVLDPAANPTLFQSTLDVVDSDKSEIVKEFSLKFQQIVQQEQDANFISKLHAGKLDIVPWPVIESQKFYTYFVSLKKALDRQRLTHSSGVEFAQTLKTLMAKLKSNDWGSIDQTLAAHRASRLLEVLPVALARGYADIYDDEPLKNMDTNEIVPGLDSKAVFHVSVLVGETIDADNALLSLQEGWTEYATRGACAEESWVSSLSSYLESLFEQRTAHVLAWMDANLERFKAEHANIDNLRRTFSSISAQMKADVELCKAKCLTCNLLCLRGRRHSSHEPHDCQTDHECHHTCEYINYHELDDQQSGCGMPAGHHGKHICRVDRHLCGEPCGLRCKKGCLGDCIKPTDHPEDEGHMCSARLHACGMSFRHHNLRREGILMQRYVPYAKVIDLLVALSGDADGVLSNEPHEEHICEARMCPLTCELCQRLCSNSDHLHALDADAHHLCGQTHTCSKICDADGICEIDTAPFSIEANFAGRHESFQYTKYTQVAKKLRCALMIPANELAHEGRHTHTTATRPFHYCESKCGNCGYFCTLPIGHSQQEHETSHGSMSETRWALADQDGNIELNGRRFGNEDEGAPMLCNLFCKEMGRHVHVDYCRTSRQEQCRGEGISHVHARMKPEPDAPKDWITHSLFWKRTGFKDPYSKEDQFSFAKCDAICPGPEHAATASTPAQPSFCILPMFHPPRVNDGQPHLGYVSNDGHLFVCKNPAAMQQAFHVMFVVDRSSSMGKTDRKPLSGTPVSDRIRRNCDNRLGAVYSALYSFWTARHVTQASSGAHATRKDAYSVVLFDANVTTLIANDFDKTPDELLRIVLKYEPKWGTNYTGALEATAALMRQHWSSKRTPVVIFLSDGECHLEEQTMQTLCQAAVQLGKHLSFHSVAFGRHNSKLQRMARIAQKVQARAPKDPAFPASAYVESSYAEAIDSIRLTETFLGLANSLRKPRGALIRGMNA
ncbi:hypothetical protein GGG16DRAFT_113392 [Schizophyllum commune]